MSVFTMMVGISYSGKSTIAKLRAEKEGAVIVSSDAIRGELYGDEGCQDNPAKVFEIVNRRVRKYLLEGKNVILDATNLSYRRRMGFLRGIAYIGCKTKCIVVVATPEDIEERMTMRERKVPMKVVQRQLERFQCPNYYEGWDQIEIVYNSTPDACQASYKKLWAECDIPHDNPHHSLSIKEHMNEAADFAEELAWKLTDSDLINNRWVARIHDIGKPRVKSFTDRNGNPTDEAHYRNHQNYSAYYSLIFDGYDFDIPENISLDNACLIQWHMEHFFRKGEALNKFYEMIGERLATRLHILEEADKKAH